MKKYAAWMRFLKSAMALSWICMLLSSCSTLIGPRDVELPLVRLQEGLDRRLPFNSTALNLLDIQLTHPQLVLLPDEHRIALTIDAHIAPQFLTISWNGSMKISGRLEIDTKQNIIRIKELRVDQLTVDGIDEVRQRQFAKAAGFAVEAMLKDQPIYRFHPDDLRFAGVQFVPTSIKTTSNAVVVRLEPVK